MIKSKNGVVYLRLKGGVGNQIFEYAFSKSLALKLNFDLVIDSRTGFFKDRYLRESKAGQFLSFFQEASIVDKFFFLVKKKIPIFLNVIFKSYFLLEKDNRQYENIDINELKKYKVVYVDGYFQSYVYFEDISNIIREEIAFKFSENIKLKILKKDIEDHDSVSVHFRRIDYEEKLDLQYYKKAASLIGHKFSNTKYYIFSDDIMWCKKNLDFMENKVFITDLGDNEIVDLYLISKCKNHIIANSTFSWWGAYLSNSKNGCVIAPLESHIGIKGKYYPKSWTII
jgi:hypothetical protein